VVLVRHCQSAVDAAAHPSTWGLTAEGQRQAADLALSPWFERAAILAAGPEPKMLQSLLPTAERLGIDVVIDDAFRETEATWLPHEEFLSSVAHLFASPTTSPANWEPSRDAGLRFVAGVKAISLSRPDDDIVVCSGGRALTSLLIELGAIGRDLAFSYWQSIRMPDIAVVDMATVGSPVMLHHFADAG
jgi:broad specificity phosphatase PhoE